VVADLEQVHGREAPRHQLGLDDRLGVACQEEASSLEEAEEHDRGVVHLAPVVGGFTRHAVGVGPEDVDGDPVEGEAIARNQAAAP
jgi:hypothetical protein